MKTFNPKLSKRKNRSLGWKPHQKGGPRRLDDAQQEAVREERTAYYLRVGLRRKQAKKIRIARLKALEHDRLEAARRRQRLNSERGPYSHR